MQGHAAARPRPRLVWPDLAKGVCILLVVLHHATTKHYVEVLPAGLAPVGELWAGLSPALKPTRMPLFFVISGWFASLLAGAVFAEFVFGWKGMGLEVFNALEREDLPVVMGAVLVFAVIFVVVNVVVDLLYAVLGPRVRTV